MSNDHPVHLFKAWQLFTHMLPTGRLSGWSHAWALGYPTGDLVPIGEEAWICLFRIATLGQLSWMATYRLAVLGVYALMGLSTYLFSRRYFGPVTSTIGALLMMLDPGAAFQGGWEWQTIWGVWPINLGLSLAMIAFAKIQDTLQTGARRPLVAASGYLAASLVAHQISIVVAAIALPLFLLESVAHRPSRNNTAWLRVLVVYVLGLGLAGFSVFPLLSRGLMTLDRGLLGESFAVWARRLAELRLFNEGWPWLVALGLVGSVTMIRNRRRGGLFLVCYSLVCLLLATSSIFATIHLERALPSLVKLESGRMVQVAKQFWFPLAACGLSEVFRRTHFGRLPRGPRQLILWTVIPLVLLAPFVPTWAGWVHVHQLKKKYSSGYPGSLYEDFLRFNAWAATERKKDRSFYRIGTEAPSLRALQTMIPMLSGTALYRGDGPTPSHHFVNSPCDSDLGLYEAAQVKFVLSDSPTPLSEPNFTLLRSFGALTVYRFNRYRPEPFLLHGGGQGRLLKFGPELIEIAVSDAPPTARLRLNVAYYDRWEAEQGGRILPIARATAYEQQHPYFMSVPVRDGVVRFRYVRRAADQLGLLSSWSMLLALAAYGAAPRRFRPARDRWVHAVIRVWERWGTRLLGVLALGVFLLLANRLRSREHVLPKNSVFHQLRAATFRLGGHSCQEIGSLDFQCNGPFLQASYVNGTYGSHLCMAATSTESVVLEGRLTLGQGLMVLYDGGWSTGTVQVRVDGTDLGLAVAHPPTSDYGNLYFDTNVYQGGDHRVEIELSAALSRCFDVRVAQ
jgi:hypothetical protein